MAERLGTLPRVLPFVILLTGVMVALYGGFAAVRNGGVAWLSMLIALIYGVWRASDLKPILVFDRADPPC